MRSKKMTKSALRTIDLAAEAITQLRTKIDQHFESACNIILKCKGRVAVTGIGKSGHIANKIASTLASTGTPAFFLHPAEASHGDLGMITSEDVVLAISNSGSTSEILTILPRVKRLSVPLISMTGNAKSEIAKAAATHLCIQVAREACPMNLAPTTSTTTCLVLGDALAISLLETRGFSEYDFAMSHPGGALGRKLLLRARDLMHENTSVPRVYYNDFVQTALLEMTAKGFGVTAIFDVSERLVGIFTDGDLRRMISQGLNIGSTLVKDVMSANPKTISGDILAAEALNIMEDLSITTLLITNESNCLCGILHMHDLVRAGVI
ncbi:MAG: D-arabinose 5-phosphate isomerase [Porticoccaceae bacterium]|nr:D-arabinose 5-phosphate isomerase [Porticoccaceae bacterium]